MWARKETFDFGSKMAVEEALLEVSCTCNLRCPFCYCTWIDHPDAFGSELPIHAWLPILKHLLAAGIKSFTFSGGEPTLRPDLLEMVELLLATRDVRKCEIYTNLKCLPDWFCSVLPTGRVSICTSLQSVSRRCENTGCPWPVSAWIDNCRKVVALGADLHVAVVVTKRNLDEFEEMIMLAKGIGSNSIQVNTVVGEGRAKQHKELLLTYDEIRSVYQRVETLRKIMGVTLTLPNEYYCGCRWDVRPPEGMDDSGNTSACSIEDSVVVIGPDGRRRKCVHLWGTYQSCSCGC